MAIQRMVQVGIVVDDAVATNEFFVELGFGWDVGVQYKDGSLLFTRVTPNGALPKI